MEKTWAAQLGYMQGKLFQEHGITGRGIRIAVLDGGFPGVTTHPAFQHLIKRGQIVGTWNFVKNDKNVFTGVSHGTSVLSCIAGVLNGRLMGLAPDAEFLLAVTEVHGEPKKEEQYWAEAVEWAIKNGAQIIQSSLGYTYHRYFREDLDGRSSVVAKAAALAARKGILIINCNGNEGQNKWQTLVTPADCDSIISVGAIDPLTGLAADYTSVGPTADGRLKPNVCAPGKVIAAVPGGKTKTLVGTSFAAPLITGFAACVWQMNQNRSAMDIIDEIQASAHLNPYFDYSHGYGVPQASRIFNKYPLETTDPFSITIDSTKVILEFMDVSFGTPPTWPDNYIYYNITSPNGILRNHGAYRITGTPISIDRSAIRKGETIRCSYKGICKSWEE
jgi:subtilisin family serine protease